MSLYATKVLPPSATIYPRLGTFWTERFADVALATAMIKGATDWSAIHYRLVDGLETACNMWEGTTQSARSFRVRHGKVERATPSEKTLNPYQTPVSRDNRLNTSAVRQLMLPG